MTVGERSDVRAETIHGQGVTEVVFRRRGVLWRAVRLVLVVAGLLAGGGFAALLLMVGDQPLMLVLWLAIWGIVGLGLIYIMVWSSFGVEHLIAHRDRLAIKRRLLVLASTTELQATAISAIRWIADDPNRSVTINGRRVPQSAVEILSGATTQRLARGISAAEAQPALAAINQRLGAARGRG